MGISSLFVQNMIEVDCFMKGQDLQGVSTGPDPLAPQTGFKSDLTKFCWLIALLLMTKKFTI